MRPQGRDAVELAGRGFGHGVGMSQWGARGQAAAGRDATEILRYYYTGVTIGPRP
jgi:SpoIID/LytB domain protein